MAEKYSVGRRGFLKQAAGAVGAATTQLGWPTLAVASAENAAAKHDQKIATVDPIAYPRTFTGKQLKMIAFPLGGVGAGSLALGGRGQLRDWEIFNCPNKGFSLSYALPSIWVQSGDSKPIAHVLESRILPPYEGESGLGSNNSPGLSRLKSATFTGEYPLAHIQFHDNELPVHVELEAFSPFIPHDADDSGLPSAILRYKVTNPGSKTAKVGIAYSIENPVRQVDRTGKGTSKNESRENTFKSEGILRGLVMTNPGLPEHDPMQGSFVLAALPDRNTDFTYWRGWPQGRWWNSPMLFWDAFSRDGSLQQEPEQRNPVGAICQQASIPAGGSATFTFILAWNFPNRTPEWCGWEAPKGLGSTVIGNYYATRFKTAWDVAQYTAVNLDRLESRTKDFAAAFRATTLPAVVKEAASANISTLASTTCFRTSDGEFHGFEGVNDHLGCCFGNCTHVWNYETTTTYLFPFLAKSLRKAAFGYSMDDAGAMHFRQLLPDGKARSGFAAADGQMGQIIHAYMDWKLSGDMPWLREMWPRIKKAIEFAWVPGGWDANKDGVLEGVQHNTYDVEFYGPNPLCGIYYLGALRASEEMARAVGDIASSEEYKKLFLSGSQWIDANLFNGSYYIQQVQGFPADKIAKNLRSDMGSGNTEHPEYQVGKGCLIDQLVGQYLAQIAGLGPLVQDSNVRKTLQSIYTYNYKRSLENHDNVERTFALNDEAAMVICDYVDSERPHIPFPYFAEVMTGFEHSTAVLMLCSGMIDQGLECIHNIRSRYDGEKRNPWDEAECGHHYARAMAAWSGVVALSGFQYDGAKAALLAIPRIAHSEFQSFWSTGTGWGTFSYKPASGSGSKFSLRVLYGTLELRSCHVSGKGASTSARYNGHSVAHSVQTAIGQSIFHIKDKVVLSENQEIQLEVHA